ncbi:MAG: S8/S53 family peptidase, partial [Actinomycetota bacterium]
IGKPADVSGTNIIGAATAPDCEVCTYTSGTDFFDTSGHGTGVSSVAGGQIYGRGGPNMIIVPIDASGDGWRWAAAQPWIDLITISWAFLYTFIDESAEGSHEAAASGKISCAASGNFTIPLLFWESEGPSSTVHVGAVDPNTRKVKDYSGFPVDVLGLTDVEAAVYNSTDGVESFGGTSAATPHVCALMARAISDARARLGDFREGPHDGGALAVGGPTGAGALSDGKLTRLELEDAVESTAVPVSTDAYHFVTGGFGLVENTTIDEALKVIFGEKPRPTRTVEDAWQLAVDAGRDAVWGFFPDCRPTPLC